MQLHKYRISNFSTQNSQAFDISLAYAIYGQLNAASDNAILILTPYSATHEDAADLFATTDTLTLSDKCGFLSSSSQPLGTKKHGL